MLLDSFHKPTDRSDRAYVSSVDDKTYDKFLYFYKTHTVAIICVSIRMKVNQNRMFNSRNQLNETVLDRVGSQNIDKPKRWQPKRRHTKTSTT